MMEQQSNINFDGSTGRANYPDLIRSMAVMSLIVVHALLAGVVTTDVPVDTNYWWFAYILSLTVYWVVPVFIMLSGLLLIDASKIEPLGVFFHKRFVRIGIPLVFWTLFYIAWRIVKNAVLGRDIPTSWDVVKSVLSGMPYVHLYFLFAIAGLYIFTPFIRVLLANLSKRQINVLAGVILAFISLDWLVVIASDKMHPWTAFSFFAPYAGYYLAGHALRDFVLTNRRQFIWCLLTAASCVLAVTGIAYLGKEHFGLATSLMWTYSNSNPFHVIIAILVFIMIKSPSPLHGLADISNRYGRFLVNYVARASLGIYLVHMVYLEIFKYIMMKYWQADSPLFLPVYIVLTFAFSLASVLIVMRIPYLRAIVGLPVNQPGSSRN